MALMIAASILMSVDVVKPLKTLTRVLGSSQDGKDPMLGLTFGAFLFSFFGPGLQRKRVRTLNDPRTGAEIDPNHHSAVTISLDPVQKSALACRR